MHEERIIINVIVESLDSDGCPRNHSMVHVHDCIRHCVAKTNRIIDAEMFHLSTGISGVLSRRRIDE